MGVGDSEQAPAADPPQSMGSAAIPTTAKRENDTRFGQEEDDRCVGTEGEENDASELQKQSEKSTAVATASLSSPLTPSPSPRRVLFGSIREALIASERQAQDKQQEEREKLTQEEAGGGYVALRRRQRSFSVGVASTVKSEVMRRELAAEAPAPDAAGYTVIRRRAASDVSSCASRSAPASNETKRRTARRNHRPAPAAAAAPRGGDKKERRARTSPRSQLQHEPRAKPTTTAKATGPASASHGTWQRASDPLGSMSSLSRALVNAADPLFSPAAKPRTAPTADTPDTRNTSAAIAPPPGLDSASLEPTGWLTTAAPDRSLWAPVSLPPPDPDALGQHQPQEPKEEEEGSAWAAATSAGVLASRSVPAWPPPPSSAVDPPDQSIAPAVEDKVASWLGWAENSEL